MLLARDLMTVDPEYVSPTSPLREVIALMNQHDCRHLPVLKDKQVVGIISDRDIRLVLNSPMLNLDPSQRLEVLDEVSAKDCMTRYPLTVSPDTPLHEIAGILVRNKIGAVLVMRNESLEGIVTVVDLLNQLALKPEL
ncbi:MAG: CBS domain-containing protein [Candidatus Promineifilaceae bacterium]|nr:CBS domain-containing protein [Candidatus Promineifilaceae bacterium]